MAARAESPDPDLEDLLAVLDDLNLDDGNLHNFDVQRRTPNSCAPPSLRTSPIRPTTVPRSAAQLSVARGVPSLVQLPHAPPRSSPARSLPPQAEWPLYQYSTPTLSGHTPHWAVAAAMTQGVPGGIPRLLTPKKKKKKKVRGEPLVMGISCNIFQSYPSFEAAIAAFEYARQRSWTRAYRSSPTSPPAYTSVNASSTSANPPVFHLPMPADSMAAANPLQAEESDLWYIVYSGIMPGVYRSFLECSLNTLGISGATHESCNTRELAVQRFENARAGGHIAVITPVYEP
ncbi:hypothetical protein B0H13DRAFT_1870704 [Mycena leptocephala]|nr:hypothetical protein B0H13DRAFT_1870704 [Mycena leptocephala]